MQLKIDKKLFIFFIPAFLVSVLLLVVYFLKGIYPFGGLTIIYSDMGQGYIPLCYHIYDVILNGKSLLWDPLLGTGSNFVGVENFAGMFSPVSWLVIFSSREGIPYFASFMLLIRMALMATTSFVFFQKAFKETHLYWKISLSVVYAFSAYSLIMYTNMMWLDIAILFPLLLLTLKNLLEKDKILPFVIVLVANLIICFYISFMVLLFLLLSSGILLIFFVDRKRIKKAILSLGVGIGSAVAFSAFVVIPAYLQASSSSRSGKFDYMSIVHSQIIPFDEKLIYLAFSALAIVFLIQIIFKFNKDKRGVIGFVLLIFITTIQVVMESINLIWHTGSYMHFPMRYSFIPIYVLLAGAAYFLSKKDMFHDLAQDFDKVKVFKKIKEVNKKFILFIVQLVLAVVAIFAYLKALALDNDFVEKTKSIMKAFGVYSPTLIFQFILSTLLFGLALWIFIKFTDKRIKFILISIVLITEMFTHSMAYIGAPIGHNGGREESVEWIYEANQVKKDFNIKSDYVSRYKDVDSVLNSNYPLVIGAPAVSTWIHMIDQKQQTAFQQMGYSVVYTRILDTGGTMFSDMLLNVNHFMTKLNINNSFNNEMFSLAGTSKDFSLYDSNFKVPFGLVYQPGSDSENFQGIYPFDNQNAMYRSLFNMNEDVIEQTINPKNISKTEGTLEFEVNVKGDQYLYLGAYGSVPMTVLVNEKPLPIPDLNNINNFQYPSTFNCGMINLGFFKNQIVNVKIQIADAMASEFRFGLLPLEKLKALSQRFIQDNNQIKISGNSISLKVNATNSTDALFLPVNYDEGWTCKVNGVSTPVKKVFSTFIKVNLNQGENSIEFNYSPVGFNFGLLFFGGALALWILGYFIKRRYDFYENKLLLNAVSVIYWPVYAGAIIIVYVIPIAAVFIKF